MNINKGPKIFYVGMWMLPKLKWQQVVGLILLRWYYLPSHLLLQWELKGIMKESEHRIPIRIHNVM